MISAPPTRGLIPTAIGWSLALPAIALRQSAFCMPLALGWQRPGKRIVTIFGVKIDRWKATAIIKPK